MQTVFWKNGGEIDIIEENYVSTTLVNHLENAADETNESLERCMQSLDSLHEKVENLDSKQYENATENSTNSANNRNIGIQPSRNTCNGESTN